MVISMALHMYGREGLDTNVVIRQFEMTVSRNCKTAYYEPVHFLGTEVIIISTVKET